MNEQEHQAYAFAELVRRQSFQIGVMIGARKFDQAAEASDSLCCQAAQRKAEIEGKPWPATTDDGAETDET